MDKIETQFKRYGSSIALFFPKTLLEDSSFPEELRKCIPLEEDEKTETTKVEIKIAGSKLIIKSVEEKKEE